MNVSFTRTRLVGLFLAISLALVAALPLVAQEDEHPDVAAPAADGSSSEVMNGDDADYAVVPDDDAPAAPPDAASEMADEAGPDAAEELPTVAKGEPAAAEAAAAQTEPAAMPHHSAKNASDVILMPAERKVALEGSSFRGVKPGKTTADELTHEWGAPKEIRKHDGVRTQIYQIENFPKITVAVANKLVKSIVINMQVDFDVEDLAQQLSLDNVSSVQVIDDRGQLLGESFPERGVLFGYTPDGPAGKVSQVVIEALDAQPFLLRAESDMQMHFARALADANAAIELDPKLASAHALRARVLARAGDLVAALPAAEAAVGLGEDEPLWRLIFGRILLDTNDFNRAKQQAQMVIGNGEAGALAHAQAQLLLGDCLFRASGRDDQSALKHHTEAIKLADPLKSDTNVMTRRMALEVLIDAHLAVANDISWGRWQQKSKAAVKWLDRAGALAKQYAQQEPADPEVQLRVDMRALAALAGVSNPPDPGHWLTDLLEQGGKLMADSPDPAWTAQFEWQFGLALSDAVEIEQARGQFDKALRYGQLASEHLKRGGAAGRQLPTHDFLVGRLNYRVGALYAVARRDHKSALVWYDRAVKCLETPVPASSLSDPGRHGETFVSMAVSYWESDQREEALRLTRQGAKLMEQAVEDGLLSKSALSVPYGNLASMHEALGDKTLATEFAELSLKCAPKKR